MRLRAAATSVVTTCMSTPSRCAEHAARIADAAIVVERVADRQRMQHGAALAHRMMAAGGEHALDVGVAHGRRLHVHGRGEQLARRAPGGDRQHDRVDMHAGGALGGVDRVAQHLLGRRDVDHAAGLHALRLGVADAEHLDRMGAARQHVLRRARLQPRDQRRRSCWCRCRARTRSPSACARSASSWGQGRAPDRSRVAPFLLACVFFIASSRACAARRRAAR